MKTHDVRDFDYLDPKVIDPDAHLRHADSGHIEPYSFGYRCARLEQDATDVVRLKGRWRPFRAGQVVKARKDAITMSYYITAIRSPLHRGKPARVTRRFPRMFQRYFTVLISGRDTPVRYGDFDDAKSPELLRNFR